jgi:hypothetical protein
MAIEVLTSALQGQFLGFVAVFSKQRELEAIPVTSLFVVDDLCLRLL